MFSRFTRIGFAAVFASLLLIVGAAADQWHVTRSSGPIWFGSDVAQLAALGPTKDVPGGATVMTGEGGRALLVRGTQTMLVGPNTVVTLPESDTNGITTILQRAGEITFDVDRQKVKHFAVETPYLAAVVKGTKFTVRIDDAAGAISVDRGLVEVSDLATGDVADTPAGQVAAVSGPGARLTISGSGTLAAVRPGKPRAPLVEPLTATRVRAMQTAALGSPAGGNGTGDASGAGLAVAGSGGSGGGSSGGGGIEVFNVPGAGSSDADRSSGSWFSGADGDGVRPLIIVVAIAVSAMAALGLAYLKGRVG